MSSYNVENPKHDEVQVCQVGNREVSVGIKWSKGGKTIGNGCAIETFNLSTSFNPQKFVDTHERYVSVCEMRKVEYCGVDSTIVCLADRTLVEVSVVDDKLDVMIAWPDNSGVGKCIKRFCDDGFPEAHPRGKEFFKVAINLGLVNKSMLPGDEDGLYKPLFGLEHYVDCVVGGVLGIELKYVGFLKELFIDHLMSSNPWRVRELFHNLGVTGDDIRWQSQVVNWCHDECRCVDYVIKMVGYVANWLDIGVVSYTDYVSDLHVIDQGGVYFYVPNVNFKDSFPELRPFYQYCENGEKHYMGSFWYDSDTDTYVYPSEPVLNNGGGEKRKFDDNPVIPVRRSERLAKKRQKTV